ncbi:hypothetical protein RhiJN_08719 [Ceratobasidium sp. AG-Ba]|nr:hypothetical protein RhiJN_08719 [Ceratobasidium sp. AG-Ba]QRW09502.1 hypothetical protein RhiLY_08501 [Ceratobasidium sp. AG-Ba]
MSTNHVLNEVRPEAAPARLAQVIDAIARTRHIMIACGDTLTREASITGIEDPVDVYYGRETRRSSLQTLLRECSPLQTSPDTLDQRLLASLNAAMAKRRIAARNCEAGPFLHFDGVEAVLNPDVDDRVFRLHGDNRTVRCCRTLCVAQSDEASAVYDGKFLEAPSAVVQTGFGGPLCSVCRQKWIKTRPASQTHTEKNVVLRLAVQLELSETTLMGEGKKRLLASAATSQLMLIVECPFKPRGPIDGLRFDLADEVHKGSGAVIYVGVESIRGKAPYTAIDLHLPITAAYFAEYVDRAVEELAFGDTGTDGEEYDPEFWYDVSISIFLSVLPEPGDHHHVQIVSNHLSSIAKNEEPLSLAQACDHCSTCTPEYLGQCQICQSHFCFRRAPYNESPDVRLFGEVELCSVDRIDNVDPFEYEDAWVVFDFYSKNGHRPALATSDFIQSICCNSKDYLTLIAMWPQ